MTQSYLHFHDFSKAFGPVDVVRRINLSIDRNHLIVFVGPSGCGKTTLMGIVGGLDRPAAGCVRLESDVVDKPDRRRGMVFKTDSSFTWLIVEENIGLGIRYRNDLATGEKTRCRLLYLKLVGLDNFARAYPNRVTGGMRRRVAIARTLAASRDVLLMDESFGALHAPDARSPAVGAAGHPEPRAENCNLHHARRVRGRLPGRSHGAVLPPGQPSSSISTWSRGSGTEKILDIRESPAFFELRNHVLHLTRNETGDMM